MLKAKNISKVYRIYDRPVDRILEALPFVLPRHWLEARALLRADLADEPAAFEPLGIALRLDVHP